MNSRTLQRLVVIVGTLIVLLAASSTSTARPPSLEILSLILQSPTFQLMQAEDGYTNIQAEGCTLFGEPGQVLLPHKWVDVALPPDVDWASLSLTVRDMQTTALPGTHRLHVAVPDLPDQDRPSTSIGLSAAAPPATVRIASTGQMRKWRLARLDWSPFRYDPATGQLEVVQRAIVELSFARTAGALGTLTLADTVMDDLAETRFVNYDAARTWYPPNQANAVYDYVIITTNAIESSSTKLASFVLHKQARGHSVLVVTEDDYGSLTGQAPNGRAEKVRKWLQNNYVAYGIEYVLLIGDPTPGGTGTTAMPMKLCWPRRGAGSDEDAPTDYFFADLTGDWDKDGDQYYGEYSGDWGVAGGVDFDPEVYVGRIPFYGSYTDLDNILQKIIDYAIEPSISWRNRILLPMSFLAAGYDGAPLAQQMWDDYLSAAGYSRWRQYQQGSGACALDSTYASDQELRGGTVVRDRWAAQDYGIVAWWGHGVPISTSVGYSGCWDGTLFDNTQTSSLDDDHPSFTYQCGDSNGYPENTSNLQYAILKRGGIATVGASRISWFNTGVGYGAFDGSTTNSGIGYEYVHRVVDGLAAGEALYQAKSSMTPESNTRLMNYYDFNLYGDPATRITDKGYGVLLPMILKDVGSWTTILNETFEGSFPGVWNVYDSNGSTYGDYYWGKRSCRSYAGSYSGWGVGAGTDGAALACGSNYPDNADSWMVYGPFSLVGATAAELNFKLWLSTESSNDGVSRLASINGTNFYGYYTSGNSGGWMDRTLNLRSVPTLGNLMGQPNVWIALRFFSNGSTNYAEGGYVDDVVLRKCMAPGCMGLSSASSDPSNSQIVETPTSVTLTR
jgi:hypothetical protein